MSHFNHRVYAVMNHKFQKLHVIGQGMKTHSPRERCQVLEELAPRSHRRS